VVDKEDKLDVLVVLTFDSLLDEYWVRDDDICKGGSRCDKISQKWST